MPHACKLSSLMNTDAEFEDINDKLVALLGCKWAILRMINDICSLRNGNARLVAVVSHADSGYIALRVVTLIRLCHFIAER
jgi:hypothetical protein